MGKTETMLLRLRFTANVAMSFDYLFLELCSDSYNYIIKHMANKYDLFRVIAKLINEYIISYFKWWSGLRKKDSGSTYSNSSG